MTNAEYKDLLKIAIETAVDAGKLAMQYFRKNNKVKIKWNLTPVTEADRSASRLIIQKLKNTNLPILSEEEKIPSYSKRKTWQEYWIIDPIDGTKEFISGRNDFTVNIALIENKKPVAGVIYVPATGTLYYGSIYLGAFKHSITHHSFNYNNYLNDKNRISPIFDSVNFSIVASLSHYNQKINKFIDDMKKNFNSVEVIRRGSSLKFCLVAEGSAVLYPRLSRINEWDIAAGHAIAEAAGCIMIQPDGVSDVLYNTKQLKSPCFFVANNKNTVKKLLVNLNI